MNYQPRYVAYLALIGGEELATNHYYISFIGIMKQQYQSFRGVDSEMPITDHKEFTAFIQQWVRYNDVEGPLCMVCGVPSPNHGPGCIVDQHPQDEWSNRHLGIDLASGRDKTILAKIDDDGNVLQIIEPEDTRDNAVGKACVSQKELHEFNRGLPPDEQDDQPRHYCKCCNKELPWDQSYEYCDHLCEQAEKRS